MKFDDRIFNEMNIITDVRNWVLDSNGQINEANDSILLKLAQNEVDTTDYDNKYDYDDAVADEYNSIIRICSFKAESLLYAGLLEWYGSEKNMLKHIRSIYKNSENRVTTYYFVTGIGYDTISQDLLGCAGDGKAKIEFIGMLRGKDTNFDKFNKSIKFVKDDEGYYRIID